MSLFPSNNRSSNASVSNTNQTATSNDGNNEEDQLNRINLQALQNRDPYISKIVDQAQRVCVFKFSAEKREWERKDLEGTLFVYERLCKPFYGFVILSTVSRETFVQIIKPSMEFKHTPTHEAFLQYKVDVGDIYGIWFISKNDCPRVTECLTNLTQKAKEPEQQKPTESTPSTITQKQKDIVTLLTNAHDKFHESKRKQDTNNSELSPAMPPALLRLFSTQETSSQSTTTNDERGEELKKTLGISGKSALSVTELERQLLQPSPSLSSSVITATAQETNRNVLANETVENLAPVSAKNQILTSSHSISSRKTISPHSTSVNSKPLNEMNVMSTATNRLMTPADFQTLCFSEAPVHNVPKKNETRLIHHCEHQPSTPMMNQFSKEYLRQLLVDMLQNDEDVVAGLYDAYVEKQMNMYRNYS